MEPTISDFPTFIVNRGKQYGLTFKTGHRIADGAFAAEYEILRCDGAPADRVWMTVEGEVYGEAYAECVEALREAELQIEYLHGKFQHTGSGTQVLTRIRAALAKLDATDREGQ